MALTRCLRDRLLTVLDSREGVEGDVGRRPGAMRRWLRWRRAVVGWSGFLALAFSVAGKLSPPIQA